MPAKITHPVARAAFGVAALVTIAIFANWLVSLTPIGNRGIDFTENKIHTLSDGTRAILSELDTPVVIRYYASRNTDYMPEELKIYMRRVDDLLKEYSNIAKGKLRIENLDPQPDTDAEDSANLDGISGQRIDGQNLYFGIAVSCLDKSSIISFLDPSQETMLEYQLSKAIAEVSTAKKTKVGVMSALDIKGSPAMMPGQRPANPWIFYQQLKQSFDIADIDMNATMIDPKVIKVLLIFHPAGITPKAEYAIDQYLLKGGTVVACLDPYCVASKITATQNPMTGKSSALISSTLPNLLPAWGVNFDTTKCLGDSLLATKLGDNRTALGVLTINKDNMAQKDNVITKDLGSVMFFIPGGFSITERTGISVHSLIKSTVNSSFIDAALAAQVAPSLNTTFRPSGIAYDLVTHLSGHFKTAFPNGQPTDTDTKATTKAKEANKDNGSLKASSADGNVFLIADVDAFYDKFAYNLQNYGGSQVATPSNGNSSLLFNILDQAVGSKHLIGSRSRTTIRRPFTVVQKMEADFDKNVGAKIQEFQEKQKVAQQKLMDLQAKKSHGSELYLSPAQEAEIKNLRQEQVDYAKLIRQQEKKLRRQKDKLASNITLLNIAGMPIVVILIGLGLYIKRRSSARAR
jgi:ABC-type uncharacterized transport system involved in gliding motility auxiliary subunit